MAFVVINSFHDLEDNKHFYGVGESYPREGLEVSEERILQLSTVNNNARKVFIKKASEDNGQEQEGQGETGGQEGQAPEGEQKEEEIDEFPKHTGGGYYELSNGEKVRGKEEALSAEQALKSGE